MNSTSDSGIEVVLFAHAQDNFLGGSVASVRRAFAYATERGIAVGLTAVLHAPTPLTRKTAEYILEPPWRIIELPGANLAEARNAARLALRQQLAAFLDGYDLWCETWLHAAWLAARERPAVWRPEVLLTFGNDFHKPQGYSAVFQPLHLSPALLLATDPAPSGFVAPRSLLETHAWPSRECKPAPQDVDRWWSCEVSASGYEHRSIESTFHYRRQPEALLERPRRTADMGAARIGPTRLAWLQTPRLAF